METDGRKRQQPDVDSDHCPQSAAAAKRQRGVVAEREPVGVVQHRCWPDWLDRGEEVYLMSSVVCQAAGRPAGILYCTNRRLLCCDSRGRLLAGVPQLSLASDVKRVVDVLAGEDDRRLGRKPSLSLLVDSGVRTPFAAARTGSMTYEFLSPSGKYEAAGFRSLITNLIRLYEWKIVRLSVKHRRDEQPDEPAKHCRHQ